MKHIIKLYFDDTVDKDIVNIIATQDIGNEYQLKAEQLEPQPPNTGGGNIWSGVALYIAGDIVSGLFDELGKDNSKSLKEKILQIKNKLTAPGTVTVIIQETAYLLTFDMQNIQTEEELNKAFSDMADIVKSLNQGAKIMRFFARLFQKTENRQQFYRPYEYDPKQKIWKIKQ